jgi:hypothetical protein
MQPARRRRSRSTSEVITDEIHDLSISMAKRMRRNPMHYPMNNSHSASYSNSVYQDEALVGNAYDLEDVPPVTPNRMSNPYAPTFQESDAHEIHSRSYPTLPYNHGFAHSTPSRSDSNGAPPLDYPQVRSTRDPEGFYDLSYETEPFRMGERNTYSTLYDYQEPPMHLDSSLLDIAPNNSFKENYVPILNENPASLYINNVSARFPVVSPARSALGYDAPPNAEPVKTEKRFRAFHEEKWNVHLEQLREFKKKYGHCLVPHTFPENQNIARWVKRQRRQYKLMLDGNEASTMTQSRVEHLNREGFIWDSHEVVWQERYSQLISFKERYGNCRVPSYCKENPQLASWVKCQRRQYKLFWDGKRSSMSVERTQLLENVGFVWEVRPLLQKQKKKESMKKLAEVLNGL